MERVSQSQPRADRPGQVTVACAMVMLGSVFVVLMMWDRIVALRSIATRQALQSFLDDGALGNGVTLAGLTTGVRVLSMVAAVCATAMAILAWETLQGSRTGRVVLTVLAVPLVVCGIVTDAMLSSSLGVLAAAVAAAATTLWFGPGRQYFDPQPQPAGPPRRPGATPYESYPPPTAPPFGTPPPTEAPPPTFPAAWAPPSVSAYDGPGDARSSRRPLPLIWACVVTWGFAALAALLGTGSIAVLAVDSQTVLDRMYEQNPQLADRGLSDHDLLVAGYAMCAVLLVWAVAAVVLSVMLFRHHRWAWYALMVSTVAVAGVSLVAAIGSAVLLVPLAGAVATIVCLTRPDVKAWVLSR
jgi:hypothetical protein